MNNKQKTFLAVVAVLAMAMAAVAAFGYASENNDAAEVEPIGLTADVTEYTIYLDSVGTSDKEIDIPVIVDLRAADLHADSTVVLNVEVSDNTVLEMVQAAEDPNPTWDSVNKKYTYDLDGSETLLTVNMHVHALLAGSSTVTVTNGDYSVEITVNVAAPTMDVTKEIHTHGAVAEKIYVTFTGNPGQEFKAYSDTVISNVTISPASEPIDPVVIPAEKSQVTAEISVTNTATNLAVGTIAVKATQGISSQNVSGFFYHTAGDAVVIGYAKDTTGEKEQVIFYSDGTALVKLVKNQSPIIKAEFGYSVGAKTGTVIVGGEEYLWLDMAGFIDPTTITNTTLKLTSNYAIADYDIASFTGAVYSITLIANDDGAKYTGYQAEFALSSDAYNLYKGLTLNECVKKVGDTNLYADMSFLVAPKEFLGYNDNEAVSALNNLVIPSAGMTVEDFIFDLIVDGSSKAYGHWNGIFQVYVNINDTTPVPGVVNVGSYYQKGAEGVVLHNLASGGSDSADTKYTIYAPTLAQAGDISIIKIINTNNRTSTYTFAFNVAIVDKDTQVITPGDELNDVNVQMLTNGVYAVSGIKSSVIVTVTVTLNDAGPNVGYIFGMESVVNTNGLGKAVARLNAFDAPARDGQYITMTGTYYRDALFGNAPVKVYGNIDNKIQSGEITYSATIDNVAVAAPGHIGLATSSAHNVYALTMSSETLGFYAVQGHYSHSTPANSDVTEYMIGSETGDLIPVTGVTLNLTSKTMTVNEVLTLVPTVAPANATNIAVTWSTSDADVATVDSTGHVTAVAAGTATITVTTVDGSSTATCAITVS